MEHITDAPLDLSALLAETENPASGALVVFAGTVRNHHEGQQVSRMQYTAYKPLAERVLGELEDEVKRRFGVQECRIVHRTGDLAIGDASVLVVVRSAHREDAFEAGKYAIDTLKVRVPVWKNDFFADGRQSYQDGVPLSSSDHNEETGKE
ncbi:MAG: molybdenum cofactor biosynthesis protein MoaE [Ectothiorhodospiraceae bacterium]|jgi:molybdopterin synthase catalytic subunit